MDVVRHLLAVQAQDLRAAKLALRARAAGLTGSAVDRALADGALVITWLNRGTLHLVAPEDHPWLLALTAPTRVAANRRRLAQEGVSEAAAERAVSTIERALADEGPLTRAQLGERLAHGGGQSPPVRVEGQALAHLLHRAALRGLIVAVGERRYARARPAPAVDRDTALRELGRRYLAAHAPAAPEDLARWAGLPLRDARAALDGAPAPPGPSGEPLGPRLLGAYDPYLLGWKDRSFAVPAEHARLVHPGGGIIRAVATVDGVVVGSWDDVAGDPAFADERADVARFRDG